MTSQFSAISIEKAAEIIGDASSNKYTHCVSNIPTVQMLLILYSNAIFRDDFQLFIQPVIIPMTFAVYMPQRKIS